MQKCLVEISKKTLLLGSVELCGVFIVFMLFRFFKLIFSLKF